MHIYQEYWLIANEGCGLEIIDPQESDDLINLILKIDQAFGSNPLLFYIKPAQCLQGDSEKVLRWSQPWFDMASHRNAELFHDPNPKVSWGLG